MKPSLFLLACTLLQGCVIPSEKEISPIRSTDLLEGPRPSALPKIYPIESKSPAPGVSTERPAIAARITGSQKVTEKVIEVLEKIQIGELEPLYEASSVFGDGGSQGHYLRISDHSNLIVFVPFWVSAFRDDIRFMIEDSGEDSGQLSHTLEEDSKLKAAFSRALAELLDTANPPIAKDQQTHFLLGDLSRILNNGSDG